MKGRKPVPTEQKAARGFPGHHPRPSTVLVAGRLEEGEQLPSPPSFNAMERRAWLEIQGALLAGGLDRADFAIVESAAVQLARAREARLDVHRFGRLIRVARRSIDPAIPDGEASAVPEEPTTLDLRRARADERDAWKEFRMLAENLPLSPAGRSRLGMVRGGKVEGGMAGELGRTLPPRARLRVVGDDADVD